MQDQTSIVSLSNVSKSINPKLRLYKRMEYAAKLREDEEIRHMDQRLSQIKEEHRPIDKIEIERHQAKID